MPEVNSRRMLSIWRHLQIRTSYRTFRERLDFLVTQA